MTMGGKKMMTETNIKNKVIWLDDASQTVKLLLGWVDEGKIKGKRLNPAVDIIPTCAKALAMKAFPGNLIRRKIAVKDAPTYPNAGAAHIQGYAL